jgi:hypothetical protein
MDSRANPELAVDVSGRAWTLELVFGTVRPRVQIPGPRPPRLRAITNILWRRDPGAPNMWVATIDRAR